MKSFIITSIAIVLVLVSSVTGLATPLKRSHVFASIPINREVRPCDRGWFLYNSFCYLVSAHVKTRRHAQRYCKKRDAELVKITSQDENDFVLALARKEAPSVKHVWIGLQYKSRLQRFFWSDGSSPLYTYWAPFEPTRNASEPCCQMHTGCTPLRYNTSSGYWNDLSCSINPKYLNGLVCKKLANQ